MADEIGTNSVQYVAENASTYDGLSDHEALPKLVVALRKHVQDEGWDPADFQVDLRQIALDGLRKHRGQN